MISVCEPPAAVIGATGWVDANLMSLRVRQAVDRMFGGVDGDATADLTTWRDKSVTGNYFTVSGGEFTTKFGGLPATVSAVMPLRDFGSRGADAAASEFALRVRYWTVHHDSIQPPGHVFFAVELLADPPRRIGPEAEAPVAAFFLSDFSKGVGP